MIGLIFCHGWSYTPSFWNNLKVFFQHYPTVMWNLGYYQESPSKLLPQKQGAMTWIGVGHSLGFAKLLTSGFPFDALVGLQAFAHFLGNEPGLNARRRKEFLFFKEQVITAPLEKVIEFQEFSDAAILEKYHVLLREDRLKQDLEALTLNYNRIFEATKIPTLILGSRGDTVVPTPLLEDNFSDYSHVSCQIHPSKGHALGHHHAPWVAEQVQAFLKQLNPNEVHQIHNKAS